LIRFTVDCKPPRATHNRKTIKKFGNRLGLGDDPELVAAKQMLALLFRKHRPKVPLVGALALEIVLHFPWNTGHTKAQCSNGPVRKSTTPDCSNLAKTIEDVLAKQMFFKNDSQVARLVVEKWYSDRPGISIEIQELEEPLG
jgi:Holliday junction resolvase RusA-like endonuclease